MPSSPTFEVIADTANENLVMVEGDSLNGVLSFADAETGAVENFSGLAAAMYLYSGMNGAALMTLLSASGDLIVGVSGTIAFSKISGGPGVGTWPYVLKTIGSGGTNTILGPAMFKVISKSQGEHND